MTVNDFKLWVKINDWLLMIENLKPIVEDFNNRWLIVNGCECIISNLMPIMNYSDWLRINVNDYKLNERLNDREW